MLGKCSVTCVDKWNDPLIKCDNYRLSFPPTLPSLVIGSYLHFRLNIFLCLYACTVNIKAKVAERVTHTYVYTTCTALYIAILNIKIVALGLGAFSVWLVWSAASCSPCMFWWYPMNSYSQCVHGWLTAVFLTTFAWDSKSF